PGCTVKGEKFDSLFDDNACSEVNPDGVYETVFPAVAKCRYSDRRERHHIPKPELGSGHPWQQMPESEPGRPKHKNGRQQQQALVPVRPPPPKDRQPDEKHEERERGDGADYGRSRYGASRYEIA